MQILGHRGARGEAPENTIAGFLYAKNLGLDAFEFDVYLAKDEKLVVIHDPTVDRTTNGRGRVIDFTSAELAALDARAGFDDYPLPCGVPLLDDVLDEVADAHYLQIEIKHDAPIRLERAIPLLLQTLAERDLTEKVVITSFDETALQLLGRLAPDYPAWSLLGAFDAMDWVERAQQLQCKQINVSLPKADLQVVNKARELGLRVGGYAGNTPQDWQRAKELKVECFTTDYPTQAREWLR